MVAIMKVLQGKSIIVSCVNCQQHEAFSISDSGLRVNLKWLFMSATPDGVVMYECCGSHA